MTTTTALALGPNRRGRPPQDVAAAMPERILASARALFLEQGFAATSVQQIAERAGATKRTLYVKIGDKEALFRTVFTEVMQEWRDAVASHPRSGSLRSDLEQIGLQLLSTLLAPDMLRMNRVMLSEAYRFPALVQMVAQQVEEGPIPQLAHLLMDARGSTGTPSLNDEIAARMLYEMIIGTPVRAALTTRPPLIAISHPDWVRQAVELFLRGWQTGATAEHRA